MNKAKSFCRAILRENPKASLEELVALALEKRDADERKFADHTGNGGAKLGHGSGGIVSLRAE